MSTKKLVVLSLSAALQVTLLLSCLLLPTVKVTMLFIASLLNGILCAAGYKKTQVLLSYIAVGFLSMMFISNYIIPAAYILFFGGYGIVHFASIDKKPVTRQAIRFAYLLLSSIVLYLLFSAVFNESILFAAPYIYFLPLIIIAGYALYQVVYQMVIKEFFRHKYLADLLMD